MKCFLAVVLCGIVLVQGAFAEREVVQLGSVPVLSPNGKQLVFEYRGDLWGASVKGGKAERLTAHPAKETRPVFSPDGKELAFASKRDGTWQTYVMPPDGGQPEQLTFHSEGAFPYAWFPEGKSLLVSSSRAATGLMQGRLFRISRTERRAEEMLFEGYAKEVSLSPDGKKLLFTSGSSRLYRRGYIGSLASRIWLRDLESGEQELVCDDPNGSRTPMWKPDGSGFYYARQRDGCFNVWEYDLKDGGQKQLTHFADGSVIIPSLAKDGKEMVFRQLFDFYRMDPRKPKSLEKIDLWIETDNPQPKTRRRYYDKAWNNDEYGSLSCTKDGLELCFTAGGDLWVMDTVLRAPRLVCGETATHEREAVFSADEECIYFLRDDGLGVNIWKAEKKDADAYWWENDEFVLTPVTQDRKARFNLGPNPAGTRFAVVEGSYELWTYNLDGTEGRLQKKAPFSIYYDWAPDGRWLTDSARDSWGNGDIWILNEAGEREPYNLSRHPNWDYNARWSPDGRVIAFVGKRYDQQTNIYYAWLQREDENQSNRERKLEDALKAMEDSRGKRVGNEDDEPEDQPDPVSGKNEEATQMAQGEPQEEVEDEAESGSEDEAESVDEDESAEVDDATIIDFEGLADRVHVIKVGGRPGNLFWSFDSKALAFHSTINGKSGTYKVVFPRSLSPSFMTKEMGEQARWLEKGSKIIWLNGGVPAAYTEKYPFKVYQETNISDYRRLAFRMVWRQFRDRFYDPRMNNLDWEAIRLKYEDAAALSTSWESFERVMEMLMGELNASHIAFDQTSDSRKEWNPEPRVRQGWHKRTAALGLRFDHSFDGPGLKVRHTVRNCAADRAGEPILPGEILLAIDGIEVDSSTDLTAILSDRYPRSIKLRVQGEDGAERDVEVEEEGIAKERELVREEWMAFNHDTVERLSEGRLGYLDIESMDFTSLRQFEKEIYACGFGKDGLVIDVRNNGGGFTSDYLLAILCHPGHAVTVPRNGEECYQQGYLPSAAWFKPITVLCNEYSASNAEIFSHAIKTLGRGKVVGVPTQRAVISASTKKVLDVGTIRMPHRGWFTLDDGMDMEYKPCVPDYIVRVHPGDIAAGRDPQLEKAVEVLMDEIESGAGPKTPTPIYAAEKRSGGE